MMPDLLWDANQKSFPWSWMNSFIKEMNFWWAKIITHNKIIFDLWQCRPLTFFILCFIRCKYIFFPWRMNSFIKGMNFWIGKNHFLTFPICFWITIIFSNLNSNCSDLLDLRNKLKKHSVTKIPYPSFLVYNNTLHWPFLFHMILISIKVSMPSNVLYHCESSNTYINCGGAVHLCISTLYIQMITAHN